MTTYRKDAVHDAALMLLNPVIRIALKEIGKQERIKLDKLEYFIDGNTRPPGLAPSYADVIFWSPLLQIEFPDGTKWSDIAPSGLPENNWDAWVAAAELMDSDPDEYIKPFISKKSDDKKWKGYYSPELVGTIKDIHWKWASLNGWCGVVDEEYALVASKFRSSPAVTF